MPNDILLQAGASGVIVFLFLGYLVKRDIKENGIVKQFTQTIEKKDAIFLKSIKESNLIQKELATKLQQFSDTNSELSAVVKALYDHNKKIAYENKSLKKN